MPQRFEIPLKLYFADTDMMGIAYHANFYDYFERARTEWFRHHGIDILALADERQTGFVLRKSSIEWLSPMTLNDQGVIGVAVRKIGNASVELLQTVEKIDGQTGARTLSCEASLTIVCVDTVTMRPKGTPADVRALFETLQLPE